MPAFKLFISHSCLHDQTDAQGRPAGQNGDLLRQVCAEFRATYGNRIEILVDIEGLLPASDWRAHLDSWLGDCDAAIILFSKRALEASDWVKFEASVLRWRAVRDTAFQLVPVILPGETTPEDLEENFWRVIDISRRQCLRDASTAAEIVAGIKATVLGELDDGDHATCFGKRLLAVRTLLAECADSTRAQHGDALQAAWQATTARPPPSWPIDKVARYSLGLARRLLDSPTESIRAFIHLAQNMHPPPARLPELFKYVRPMWVSAEAAEQLQDTRGGDPLLLLNGDLVNYSDDALGTSCFTLERYIERAQLKRSTKVVLAAGPDSEDVRNALRQDVDPRWHTLPAPTVERRIDRRLRESPEPVIALIPFDSPDQLDARRLDALRALRNSLCPPLICIFAPGGAMPEAVPVGIQPILPELDPDFEYDRYLDECDAVRALDAI
ncbi:MAG: toll/interleukin-1 receptor domain-containing protein [Rhodocyclaceae bacterium]|nr:toll/interleukin-1 receptor domain-containing protein [Rhodocyclaceae bacterium]